MQIRGSLNSRNYFHHVQGGNRDSTSSQPTGKRSVREAELTEDILQSESREAKYTATRFRDNSHQVS